MPTNMYKFLMDGLFDRQKTMDFKTYLLLLLCHLAIDRANNRSFPISSQLNRSEVPTFSPRVGHSNPHISPITRAEICCKVPIKSPYSPHQLKVPPLGKPMTSALLKCSMKDMCWGLYTVAPIGSSIYYPTTLTCLHPSNFASQVKYFET